MLPDDLQNAAPQTDDTERLVTALRELEPRPARLLELRLLYGKTDAEVAIHFGMPSDAYSVHLLRAARSFMAAYMPVWGRADRDVPVELEQTEGAQLVEALSSGSSLGSGSGSGSDADADADAGAHPSPVIHDLARALRHLRDHGPAVRARLEQLQNAEAASPAAHRETLIRRALIVVLVVVTLYLYFTRPTF